jgi:hypothetical protein
MLSRCAALLLFILAGPLQVSAQPSTFSPTIGAAITCLDHLEPGYYYNYLVKHFGPPYKQEGGAYWFKTKAQLWTIPVSEVFVSEHYQGYYFIGVVSDLPPDKLTEALTKDAIGGVTYFKAIPDWQHSPYFARAGGEVVWHEGKKGKAFCKVHNIRHPGG